ncbi:diguanylate cyclase [Oceanispirochaeta crateris]|uniref:Diguanylate cyclase n=1 Tax=Oceanispirochaeta crateris TaxID=2518645 RepID=A0A5C1QH22_9SPIO|nr:diguanylate cyclase [Oceanispirochaeta crateris]
MLPGTSKEHALTLAERIRKTVEKHRYEFESGKQAVAVTITLGVSVVNPRGIIRERFMLEIRRI